MHLIAHAVLEKKSGYLGIYMRDYTDEEKATISPTYFSLILFH